MGETGESVHTKLDRFLLTYRATPTTLGKSPSELLMNRQPRIRFSALRTKPSKQEVKIFQDNLDNKPKYTQNQAVFVRNFGKGARWVPGMITGTISPRNYDIQVGDVVWKRHEEQLRPRYIPMTQYTESKPEHQRPERDLFSSVQNETVPVTQLTPTDGENTVPQSNIPAAESTPDEPTQPENNGNLVDTPVTPPSEELVRRYPGRDRKPPPRFY